MAAVTFYACPLDTRRHPGTLQWNAFYLNLYTLFFAPRFYVADVTTWFSRAMVGAASG